MRTQETLAPTPKAVPFRGAAVGPASNDNECPRQNSTFPPNARALIHCPAPSVMSSGRRRAAEWVLEFEPRAPLFVEPLMGWTGSTDTLSQVRLRFPSREAAVAYARQQGLRYEIRDPTHIRPGDLPRSRPQMVHHLPVEVAWAWEAPHLALDNLNPVNDRVAAVA